MKAVIKKSAALMLASAVICLSSSAFQAAHAYSGGGYGYSYGLFEFLSAARGNHYSRVTGNAALGRALGTAQTVADFVQSGQAYMIPPEQRPEQYSVTESERLAAYRASLRAGSIGDNEGAIKYGNLAKEYDRRIKKYGPAKVP